MSDLTLRRTKGSELTHNEMDDNLVELGNRTNSLDNRVTVLENAPAPQPAPTFQAVLENDEVNMPHTVFSEDFTKARAFELKIFLNTDLEDEGQIYYDLTTPVHFYGYIPANMQSDRDYKVIAVYNYVDSGSWDRAMDFEISYKKIGEHIHFHSFKSRSDVAYISEFITEDYEAEIIYTSRDTLFGNDIYI
jgi:hypothetical protein